MPRQSMNLLCSYRYDPLDRMVACATSAQASTQRFYQRDRLATEIQGTLQHSIMQHDDHLLAQQQRQASTVAETSLLATDRQRSVLTLLDAKRPRAFAYIPYGYCLARGGLRSLFGFNGERPDPVTGWYLLGNGFRAFNPVLMRFNSPDSVRFSPFGEGGLNAYVYCGGDPVNHEDRSGNSRWPFGIRLPSLRRLRPTAISTTESPENLSNSASSSTNSLDTTPLLSSSPPPSTKLDIDTVINTAENSIREANTTNYSGQKLKSLKRSVNKLKEDFKQHEKLTRRAERRLRDDFYGDNIFSSDLYSDARLTVSKHLDRRAAKVNSKTEKLNYRIRGS